MARSYEKYMTEQSKYIDNGQPIYTDSYADSYTNSYIDVDGYLDIMSYLSINEGGRYVAFTLFFREGNLLFFIYLYFFGRRFNFSIKKRSNK